MLRCRINSSMGNETYINEFYLLPFSIKSRYTSLTTSVFILLYVFGVIINSTIIAVISTDVHLHTPMYVFISNLALVDICFITTTVPKLLHILLSGDNTVSSIQCFSQIYFFASAGSVENILIFIMAFDRFVAICDPLHYNHILNRKHCILLALGTWIGGALNSSLFTISASHMSFCQSHNIHQFFCDAKALINISCAGSEEFYLVIYLEFLILGLFPVMFNSIAYIKIIRVILKIKSKDGRNKAFSTCSSHLTVVIMYYMTCFSAYMLPISNYSNVLEQVLTAVYSVVTPMINPLIYSLRNKDVKSALLRLLGVKLTVKKISS